jgi:deoxyribodipyrimidine photo-lyase
VIALFVLDPALWNAAGPHRGPQLAANLLALDGRLRELGGRLRVLEGTPASVVPSVAADSDGVYWNGDVSPYAGERDTAVTAALPLAPTVFWGNLVHPPGSVLTNDGEVYKVFTPFHKRWAATEPEPWPEPGTATVAADGGDGVPTTADPLVAPGEAGAVERLAEFLEVVDGYHELRNRPDSDATSRLSVDLKFGTVAARHLVDAIGDETQGRAAFVRQLAWREFYAHLLAAEPRLVDDEMRPEYTAVRWIDDPDGLVAWQVGKTGYPFVDAGMRQLAVEGYMHNRVRMITASFLVKDLLIDWRHGERHFRHLLVDADPAQNVGNWQWVAGTGADAAPYFRIFNPVTQSKRFDPDGEYIKRWVPELRGVAPAAIHAPWQAAALEGVELGTDYPLPIVDHGEARQRALDAYAAAKG